MIDLIKKFGTDPLFNEYYFVGGTALASYLDHRISYDIDFVSTKKLSPDRLETLCVKYGARYIPDPFESTFKINTGQDHKVYKMQFMIEGVKVEFFYPNDALREQIVTDYKDRANDYMGLKRLPLEAIAQLKLVALFGRNKIRDLFDIFYLFHKNFLSCEDIDRFMSLRYHKTFVEFLDEFQDDGSESLDFRDDQEFAMLKRGELAQLKELFKREYIQRCI